MNRPTTIDSELTLKGTPPRVSKSFLPRGHLALDTPRLRDSCVIFVAAPTGYGKTSLLTQWRREALARGGICAWLTLDERDSAERLVRGLRMALVLARGTAPSAVVLEQLLTPDQSPTHAATSWLADISELASEVVVFLDDVHALPNESAHHLLAYLVANAPSNLLIVLASRAAALPSVMELVPPQSNPVNVTAVDLRLSAPETERLLQLQLDAKLEHGLAVRLHELSGGWPLGLQLIVSTVRGSPNLRTAIDTMAVDSGDVARFFRQCLDQLSPEQMHFLLQISIVDVVTPELCEALTQHVRAASMLEELCAVTPLFGEAMTLDWLRMHALGLDYLRERARRALPAVELDRLHLAACRWFEANGMPEPAARHALAAGSADIAFDLAEQGMPQLLVSGDFDRLLEWLDRIPMAEVLKRPGIATSAIWTLASYTRSRARANALIEAVLDSPLANASAKAAAAAALLFLGQVNDEREQAEARLQRWSSELDQDQFPLVQMRISYRVLSLLHEGRPAEARQLCLLNAPAAAAFFIFGAAANGQLALAHYWEGRMDMIVAICRPAAEQARSRFGRRSIASTVLDLILATAVWELGDEAQACALMADRADLLEQISPCRLVLYGHVALARVALYERNESRALQVLENLFVIGQVRNIPRLLWESLAEQIRMHAHANRSKTCATLMERMEIIGASVEARSNLYLGPLLDLRLSISRAYVCLARQDFCSAMPHALEAAEIAKDLRVCLEGVATQLLLALCKRRLGEEHETLLAEAVGVAALYGLKRIIRDTHPDIQAMIDAVKSTSPLAGNNFAITHDEAVAPVRVHGAGVQIMPSALLTPKEREVLRHLAEGCANKRIASILGVSDETVKWHLKNLSAKLGGANRRHVVDRARQMGIVA